MHIANTLNKFNKELRSENPTGENLIPPDGLPIKYTVTVAGKNTAVGYAHFSHRFSTMTVATRHIDGTGKIMYQASTNGEWQCMLQSSIHEKRFNEKKKEYEEGMKSKLAYTFPAADSW